MKSLHSNQKGFLLTVIIIVVIVTFGYIAWQNFLRSDEGQKLQETTNQVIDTIENTTAAITQ